MIMDYEKKHQQEVDRATQLWECGDITRENLEYIFPELKKSENEKMKNWILDELRLSYHYAAGDRDRCEDLLKAIAWLEKQNSVKFNDEKDERIREELLKFFKLFFEDKNISKLVFNKRK